LKDEYEAVRMAVLSEIDECAETIRLSREAVAAAVLVAAQRCITTLQAGGKILIAGNGGSAADAQHFAAELTGRYRRDRRGLPAIALTTDTSFLTACANDYGYERVFARQLEAIGCEGDLFIGISTSGNSENIVQALDIAKKNCISTVLLTGRTGGCMHGVADNEANVQSTNTSRIQEVHILFLHLLAERIEAAFTDPE